MIFRSKYRNYVSIICDQNPVSHQWAHLFRPQYVNPLRPRQNGRQFADDIFKRIFLNENIWIRIEISLKFVPKGSINNIPALVQIMAWPRPGHKPLSEPMMVYLPTHICITRPQWVKWMLQERSSVCPKLAQSCWVFFIDFQYKLMTSGSHIWNCCARKELDTLYASSEAINTFLGFLGWLYMIVVCKSHGKLLIFVCISLTIFICPRQDHAHYRITVSVIINPFVPYLLMLELSHFCLSKFRHDSNRLTVVCCNKMWTEHTFQC